MKRKISIVLMIFMSLLFLSSCKSKTEIKRQVSRIVNFYDATSIMEKFKGTERKYVVLQSSSSQKIGEYHHTRRMVLQYDCEEKVFYGKFVISKKIDGQSSENDINIIQYVKLDKDGYHPREGEKLSDEIRDFKFMFEVVNFNNNYLSNVKLTKAIYDFELPDYYVEYKLTKKNSEIEKYLKNIGYNQFGWGESISFTVDDFGENSMYFLVDSNSGAGVSESISYPSDYTYGNYKLEYKKLVEEKNK